MRSTGRRFQRLLWLNSDLEELWLLEDGAIEFVGWLGVILTEIFDYWYDVLRNVRLVAGGD